VRFRPGVPAATFVLVLSAPLPGLMRPGSGHQIALLGMYVPGPSRSADNARCAYTARPNARYCGTQSWPDGSVASSTML
jgi:hypothetical protein